MSTQRPHKRPRHNERSVLLQMCHTLQGLPWNVNDPGQLRGVTCNTSGNVTSINLASNNITGDLSAATQDFLQLTHLEELWVQDNKLTGVLPTVLARHPTLIRLDVSRNQLSGVVPSAFVLAEQHIFYDDEDDDAHELTLDTEVNIFNLIVDIREKNPRRLDGTTLYFDETTTTAAPAPLAAEHRAVTLQNHPYFQGMSDTTARTCSANQEHFLQAYLFHREWEDVHPKQQQQGGSSGGGGGSSSSSSSSSNGKSNTTAKVFKYLNFTVNSRLSKFYRVAPSSLRVQSSVKVTALTREQQRSINDRTSTMCDPSAHNTNSTTRPPLTKVYVSRSAFTPEECQQIIQLTEEHGRSHNGWQTDRHKVYKTVDVDVRNIPELLSLCNSKLSMAAGVPGILHTLAHLFQLNVEDIVVDDLFVVKYSCGDTIVNQTSLPAHQDDSVLSFVISLNTVGGYVGGGTEFVNWKSALKRGAAGADADADAGVGSDGKGEDHAQLQDAYKISQPHDAGTMTAFCGLQLHAGRRIVQGTRYILVS